MIKGLEHAFFYGSENHDRVYNANSMEYLLKKFFTTGVFAGEFQVIANGDMSVKLTGGYVNIGGKVKVYLNDQDLILETAHATYDRIDSIVLERNDSDRDIFVKVVKGGYSSNPVPLVPARGNGVDQRVVAQIYIAHGAVKITQADITDTRTDPELCGMVAGTAKEMDFSQFQKQFDGYFNNYKIEIAEDYQRYLTEIERLEAEGILSYENMVEVLNNNTEQFKNIITELLDQIKGQLSEDAAVHLQFEISELDTKLEEKIGEIETLDFDDSGEGIESFTDFMSSFVKGTSIYQFFANLKAGLKYVLHLGMLVNNGTCDTPGEFSLDAAYGKTLTDMIIQLKSEIQDSAWTGTAPDGMEYSLSMFLNELFDLYHQASLNLLATTISNWTKVVSKDENFSTTTSFTIENGILMLSCSHPDAFTGANGSVKVTKVNIDLTYYKKLVVSGSVTFNTTNSIASITLKNALDGKETSVVSYSATSNSNIIYEIEKELDVTAFTGEYYIIINLSSRGKKESGIVLSQLEFV